jgi:hypothetical protein
MTLLNVIGGKVRANWASIDKFATESLARDRLSSSDLDWPERGK